MIEKLIIGRMIRPSAVEIDGYHEAGLAPGEQRGFVRNLCRNSGRYVLCTLSIIQISELLNVWHDARYPWIPNVWLRSPHRYKTHATSRLIDVEYVDAFTKISAPKEANWYHAIGLISLLANGDFDHVLDAEENVDTATL